MCFVMILFLSMMHEYFIQESTGTGHVSGIGTNPLRLWYALAVYMFTPSDFEYKQKK
jgi:hypothetical protein